METIDLTGLMGVSTQSREAVNDILPYIPHFSEMPVYVGKDYYEAGKFKAIVNDLNHETIAVRGKGYALIQHEDVLKAVVSAMASTGLGVKQVKPKYVGGKMYTTVLFKDHDITIGKNDRIQTGVHIINSVDGSTGIVLCPATFRLVCQNQFGHRDFANSVVKWHCGNPSVLMRNLIDSVSNIVGSIEQIRRSYETWTKENVNVQLLKTAPYVEVLNRLPQKYVKAIVEEAPKNKWELFNVLTDLNTHDINRSPTVQHNFDGLISEIMAV